MKKTIFLILIILFFFVISNKVNAGYITPNSTCKFYPKIKFLDYDFELYGQGEYYPDLVQNQKASYFISIKVLGNWSKFKDDIILKYFIKCDGNDITGGHNVDRPLVTNNSTHNFTDFISEDIFYIPKDSRSCSIDVTDIYAKNDTWERISGCNLNCYCIINDLSGQWFNRYTKQVYTLPEYQSKKALEKTEKEIFWLEISVIASAIFSFVNLLVAIKNLITDRQRLRIEGDTSIKREEIGIQENIQRNLENIKQSLDNLVREISELKRTLVNQISNSRSRRLTSTRSRSRRNR